MAYNEPVHTTGVRSTADSAYEGRLKMGGRSRSRRRSKNSIARKKVGEYHKYNRGKKMGRKWGVKPVDGGQRRPTPVPTKPMPVDRNLRPVQTPVRTPTPTPTPTKTGTPKTGVPTYTRPVQEPAYTRPVQEPVSTKSGIKLDTDAKTAEYMKILEAMKRKMSGRRWGRRQRYGGMLRRR